VILRPGCYQVQAIATLPSKIEFLITILRIQILILCTYRTGLNSRFSQNNKIQIPRTCRGFWWEKVQSFTVVYPQDTHADGEIGGWDRSRELFPLETV